MNSFCGRFTQAPGGRDCGLELFGLRFHLGFAHFHLGDVAAELDADDGHADLFVQRLENYPRASPGVKPIRSCSVSSRYEVASMLQRQV